MRGKSFWSWILVVAAIVLPLVMSGVAHAESGCHRTGGTTTGSTDTGPNR